MICVRVANSSYGTETLEHPNLDSWEVNDRGDLHLSEGDRDRACYPAGEWKSVELSQEIRPTLTQVAEAADEVIWGAALTEDRERVRDVALSIVEDLRKTVAP